MKSKKIFYLTKKAVFFVAVFLVFLFGISGSSYAQEQLFYEGARFPSPNHAPISTPYIIYWYGEDNLVEEAHPHMTIVDGVWRIDDWLDIGVLPSGNVELPESNGNVDDHYNLYMERAGQGYPGLSFDEYGYGPSIGASVAAFRLVKETYPDLFIMTWFYDYFMTDMLKGSDVIDIFVFERYELYIDGEPVWPTYMVDDGCQLAIDAGVSAKTIIGLWTRHTNTPTEIEGQIQTVRTMIPESPGIAFYHNSAPFAFPYRAEYDALVAKYFFEPSPTAMITSPHTGDNVSRTVEISINATPNSETQSPIVSYRYFIDNVCVRISSDPIYQWDISAYSEGSHIITVHAVAEDYLAGVHQINVIVGEAVTGTISGNVTDKDTGFSIEGATVTANGYSNTTNNTGGYTITDVPVGNYIVTASATGYYSQTWEDIEVFEDQTTTVDFQLTEAPDLVGLWHFDEGEGTIAVDSSGNGNNGTIYGATRTEGKFGSALHFDGSDDYLQVFHQESLSVTGEITIMAWVKTTGTNSYSRIASKKNGHYAQDGYELLYCPDILILGGLPDFDYAVGSGYSPDGEWHHIAGVIKGTTGTLYFDGEEVTTDPSVSPLSTTTHDLFIGRAEWTDTNYWFNGAIDEVKIYNRALSAEEIKADYEAGLEDVTPPETTITSAPDGTIDYNDVSFNWTGSDDVTPTSQLVYSHKLENYDSDWSFWTSVTTKSYNDLPNGNYTFKVKAKDEAGKEDPTPAQRSFTVLVDLSPNGSISGTITYTCNETGIAGVTVNLTNLTGSVIASTTTDSSGNYTFTDISPSDYTVNVSKPGFWSNSTSVTVNADTSTIINLMLWLKGDLNNDGTSAGIEDVAMMDSAWKDEIPKDFRYDLNNDGTPADIGDRAMMESAWEREIVLM